MMILPLDEETALAKPPQMKVNRVVGSLSDIGQEIVVFENRRDHEGQYQIRHESPEHSHLAACKIRVHFGQDKIGPIFL